MGASLREWLIENSLARFAQIHDKPDRGQCGERLMDLRHRAKSTFRERGGSRRSRAGSDRSREALYDVHLDETRTDIDTDANAHDLVASGRAGRGAGNEGGLRPCRRTSGRVARQAEAVRAGVPVVAGRQGRRVERTSRAAAGSSSRSTERGRGPSRA